MKTRLFPILAAVPVVSLFLGLGAQATEAISLNGPWRFAYTATPQSAHVNERFTVAVMVEPNPRIPTADQFALDMPVPGYWDEELPYIPPAPWGDRIQYNTIGAHPIRFPSIYSGRPRHPDAGTPYIRGVGWYKKEIEVPEEWRGRTVTLHIDGARIHTYAYVNGIFIDQFLGHGVPFEFDLTPDLKYGETNEIILGVSNHTEYINSCSLRGYAGKSGGINGDVTLRVSAGPGKLESFYVYPENGMEQLRWKAELDARFGLEEPSRVHWALRTLDGETLHAGVETVRPMRAGETLMVDWSCPADGVAHWSVWDPTLHEIEVRWEQADGALIDTSSRRYGLRLLEQRGTDLYLNGRPIMLRGICEIYVFTPDIHPPNDVDYFRERLEILKEVGFNYIRFHTWVPMTPYLEAANEVGMLLSPEHSSHRNLQHDERWEHMVRWTRYHPSVIRYAGGNEEVGHEGLIARFAERWHQAKALAPDILITPMHTISGPERVSGRPDLPLPQHWDASDPDSYYDTLWARITRYADIFAARANDFSYANFSAPDWRQIEPEYARFELPILAHESGILGTYLDFSLEERYTGTQPADLYKAAREYLTAMDRFHMVETYHENSARWHGQARKFILENLRKIDAFNGYDLLGGWDSHWHNAGYGCGMLNEFFEVKPGDTVERLLQYNGESVLLLDNAKRHIFPADEALAFPIMASLYGGQDLVGGTLTWQVLDEGSELLRGTLDNLAAPDGRVSELGTIRFEWPALAEARHLMLAVSLEGSGYSITNEWDFWVFPERPAPVIANAAADAESLALLGQRYGGLQPLAEAPDAQLRIVQALDEDGLAHLANGGDILLLGAGTFPHNQSRYLLGVAGRAHMNLATVVNEHPALQYLPHAGWADWQFYDLLEHGQAVEFNLIPIAFDPIVEIVSSYKLVRLQASMWEAQADAGRLFFCGLNLDRDNPAAVAVMDGVLEYLVGDAFQPAVEVSIDEVLQQIVDGIVFEELRRNDGNFYGGREQF